MASSIGAWVPHIPLAKERLDVGPGVFGLALLAFAGGAVCAMPVAGVLINRYGSARLTTITGLLFCLTFFGPILAPTLPTFVLAGFAMGMMIGSMDVAMNAHGIAVEKALKRPTMSMLHGGFSIGGMIGAFLGGALLRTFRRDCRRRSSSPRSALAIQIAAARFYLPADADKGLSGSHFAWPTRATIGLGLLCFLALMIEGSILDWAAIMMREKFADRCGLRGAGLRLLPGRHGGGPPHRRLDQAARRGGAHGGGRARCSRPPAPPWP